MRGETVTERFSRWAGMGLPRGWAENMGISDPGDTVWPIVDNETCGPIDDWPKPEQMLCWCPSVEKSAQVYELFRIAEFFMDWHGEVEFDALVAEAKEFRDRIESLSKLVCEQAQEIEMLNRDNATSTD